MIDWIHLGPTALWIIGLATILATLSYHHWAAGATSRRLRDVLARASWRLPFSAGMVLTSLGFGYGPGVRWWVKIIWTALALSYGYQLAQVVRERRRKAGS
jgi:hypothetical protein